MEEEMKNEEELALQIRNLKSCFFTGKGVVPAVDDAVSYTHLTLPTILRV